MTIAKTAFLAIGLCLFISASPAIKQFQPYNYSTPENHEPEAPYSQNESQKLQNIVEKQVSAIRRLDYSYAYYAFTSKIFQKKTSLEAFKQYLSNFPAFFRNKTVGMDHTTFSGNLGTYYGKLISTDGKAAKIEVNFILEDSEWKIYSIKISQ
jgi:hypothetical protein